MADLGSIWLEAAGQEKRAQQAEAALKQRAVESQQRAHQEQQRLQIQQQESTRQAQLEQTRLQVNTQIQQQQLDLQRQRIKQEAQAAQQKAQAAAAMIADQRSFATDLANGITVKDALYRHPRLATPAAVSKANEDAERIKQHRDEMEARQLHAENAELDRRTKEQAMEDAKAKAAAAAAARRAVGTAHLPIPPSGPDDQRSPADRGSITVPGDDPRALAAQGRLPIPDSKNANEVIRHTKDGKAAVFDASTKKFLRYADNTAKAESDSPDE